MTKEELYKIAKRYEQDELKDNHSAFEDVVAAAFLNGIDYAEHHPHWTSVEDELPKGEEAICLLDNGERVIMECDMVDKMNRYSTHHYITHWMPLPSIETIINKQL